MGLSQLRVRWPGPPSPGAWGGRRLQTPLSVRPAPAPADPCLSDPAVVLSAGVAAISLFVLSRLCARGRLHPLGLLLVMKESLLLSDRKPSLL